MSNVALETNKPPAGFEEAAPGRAGVSWRTLASQIEVGDEGIKLKSMADLELYAQHVAKSTLIRKELQGKPADCFVILECGMGLGLRPMQSLQDIVIVDAKPTLPVQLMLALVYKAGQLEQRTFDIGWMGEGENMVAHAVLQRTGGEPQAFTFSVADAKTAHLWGRVSKDGKPMPWSQYPKWMLLYRALSFGLRLLFADILKGVYSREEMRADELLSQLDTSAVDMNAIRAKLAEPAAPVATETPVQPPTPSVPETTTVAELGEVVHVPEQAEPPPDVYDETPEAQGTRDGLDATRKRIKAAWLRVPPAAAKGILHSRGMMKLNLENMDAKQLASFEGALQGFVAAPVKGPE